MISIVVVLSERVVGIFRAIWILDDDDGNRTLIHEYII